MYRKPCCEYDSGVGGAKCLDREKMELNQRDYDTERNSSVSRISSTTCSGETGQPNAFQ